MHLHKGRHKNKAGRGQGKEAAGNQCQPTIKMSNKQRNMSKQTITNQSPKSKQEKQQNNKQTTTNQPTKTKQII